jgi:hypothetical protein
MKLALYIGSNNVGAFASPHLFVLNLPIYIYDICIYSLSIATEFRIVIFN